MQDVGTDVRAAPPGKLSDIGPVAFGAPLGACGRVGRGGDGTLNLRYVLRESNGTAVRQGDTLKGAFATLGPEDVTVDDGVLFEAPDLKCGGNGGGSNGGLDDQCADPNPFDGQCQRAKYQCSVPSSTTDPELTRCQSDSSMSVESTTFLSDTSKNQLFGVLMENGASVEGFYPQGPDDRFYDSDCEVNDGKLETDGRVSDELRARQIASDPQGARKAAIDLMGPNWKNMAKEASELGMSTRFGLWSIDGEKAPVSMVNRGAWTEDPGQVGQAIDRFRDKSAQEGRSATYEAIQRVIRENYVKQRFRGYDKTLVVFVDGPPEVPADVNQDLTADKLVRRARDQWNVRLFIIHLDRAVDKSYLRDDPQYYGRQGETCSSDADCRLWEVCRKVHGYSSQSGEITADDPKDNWKKETYCMPHRNQAGRFGPIETYSRLSCVTGGGYIYVRSPDDLTWALKWMPLTMNGLWESTVNSQKIRRGNYTPGAGIRVGASMQITAGGNTVNKSMSITGESTGGQNTDAGDNRGVVFTQETN
jgi:hypothetical protein